MDIVPEHSKEVEITFANTLGEKVTMVYDVVAETLSFDRRDSGIVDFSQDFPSVTVAPTFSEGGKLKLQIFVDRSSMEVFGNDGRSVMTNLVFPNEPYSVMTVKSRGGKARVQDLKVYNLK